MSQSIKKAGFVFATCGVVSALAGCGPKLHTVYTPPMSADGQQCVQRCHAEANQCKAYQRIAYNDCVSSHRYYGDVDFGYASRGGWLVRPSLGIHSPQYACSSARDSLGCDTSFKQCFQMCGGQIQTYKVSREQAKSIPKDPTPEVVPGMGQQLE